MKKNTFWRVALPVGIALWTALVWSQSLLSAEASSAESGRVVRWLMGLLGWETKPEWLSHAVRKTAHFIEFAVLGALWGGCDRAYGRRLWRWGLPTAAIDEGLQFFAPGRAPMVTDLLIDTAGYLCGVAVVRVFAYLRRKKMK